MNALPPERRQQRAALAWLVRYQGPEHPSVLATSQQFAVDRLVDRVLELGERFPEITSVQRTQLDDAVAALGPERDGAR